MLKITSPMKGLFKGLRYIARVFEDEKEPDMQIGQPTDVKHVAHIGWEGPSATTPSWMDEYTSPVGESNEGSNKKPESSGERQRHKGRRNKTSSTETNSSHGGSTRQSKRNNGKQREQNNGSGLESPLHNDRSREPKQSRQRKSKGPRGGGGGEGGEPSPIVESVKSKETDITVRAVYPFASSLGSSTGR